MKLDPPLDKSLPAPTLAALELCQRITQQGQNNLHQAAVLFGDEQRYGFFVSCYAAMRVLDDAVDEGFLALPADERERQREHMLALIDKWMGQVEQAQKGEWKATDDSFEPQVFLALSHYLSRSDLGVGPFELLAQSLRRDVDERPLSDWSDFLGYCEGASVAPGSIFIYLLSARPDEAGLLGGNLPQPPEVYAREIAVFCYITHILRDLAADAERNPQLLTVPLALLDEAGLDRGSFRKAAREGDHVLIAPVVHHLREQAEALALQSEQRIAELAPHLETRSLEILKYLYELYRRSFEELGPVPGRAST